MPTPLAHGALALLGRPLLHRRGLAAMSRRQRWSFYGLMLLALWAPDVDFALKLLPDDPMHDHGTMFHSFVAAAVFAPLFALVARGLFRLPMSAGLLAAVGGLCYVAHLLMDACTRGRGVMLLWPFTAERYVTPVPLFFGAEHSQPWAWRLHLISLATELAFVLGVWLVARWLMRERAALPAAGRAGS